MKKGFTATLVLLLLLSLIACGGNARNLGTQNEVELIVFAAASMSGVLLEIAEIYEDVNPDVNIIFNFDSSGTLRTQIQEGADADIFISAAAREMDQLYDGGFILIGTRVDFLENQTVLVVPGGNPRGIESFSDMADALLAGDVLMAMGNMDVPAGRYAHEILTHFGLYHAELAATGVISYGGNVREVALQVREGSVDMGIVYLTDAVEHGLRIADVATPEMSGRVIYPAAVLSGSKYPAKANSFLYFLVEGTAMEVFVEWGFTPLGFDRIIGSRSHIYAN